MAQQPQGPGGGGLDLGRASMGTKGLLISAAVLFISLFLPWQGFAVIPGFPGVNITGWAGIGILVGLLALAVIVWEGLQLFGVRIQTGTVSPALIGAGVGGAAALFGLINFLTKLSAIRWGAFVGLIAVLALGYAAYVRFTESKTTSAGPPPPAA